MVGEARPGLAREGLSLGVGRQPVHEGLAIPVVPEDRPALKPAGHDVVEHAGGLEAGAAGHGRKRSVVAPGKQNIAATAATSPCRVN